MSDMQKYIEERKKRSPEFAEGFEEGYKHFKIGVLIRQAREEAGMTQEELARKLVLLYAEKLPQVAEFLDETAEEVLACFNFPEDNRRRIRTTNGLERLHEEIRRRTRVVRIFPNEQACLRLVSALAAEQHELWISGRLYLNMTPLTELNAENQNPVTPMPETLVPILQNF